MTDLVSNPAFDWTILQALRRARGDGVAFVAQVTGLGTGALYHLEAGDGVPRPATLEKLGRYYGAETVRAIAWRERSTRIPARIPGRMLLRKLREWRARFHPDLPCWTGQTMAHELAVEINETLGRVHGSRFTVHG